MKSSVLDILEKINKDNLGLQEVKRLILTLDWIKNNQSQKILEIEKIYKSLESYSSKLEKDLKEKYDQLTTAKSYSSKLEKDLKEKLFYCAKLEDEIHSKDKDITILKQSKRKYYSSRL